MQTKNLTKLKILFEITNLISTIFFLNDHLVFCTILHKLSTESQQNFLSSDFIYILSVNVGMKAYISIGMVV